MSARKASLAGVISTLFLSACSMAAPSPSAKTVQVDGKNFQVEELTASTWTVAAPSHLAGGPAKTATLVRAIETASNCKVTDTGYSGNGAVMSAQVDCGSKIKN